MQPMQQPIPNGLVSIPGPCGPTPRWPSATMFSPNIAGSLYGHYLANSTPQSIPGALGPSNSLTSTQESITLPTPALLAAAVALQTQQQGLSNSSLLTASPGLPPTSAFAVDAINSKVNSVSSPAPNGGLSLPPSNTNEVWLPPKRSNLFTTPSASKSEDTSVCSNGESNGVCNGKDHVSDESLDDYKTNVNISDFGSSFCPPSSACPLNCPTTVDASMPQIQPNVSSLLNPLSVNLYGIPLSAPQSATSPYGPSQFIYPPLYSPHAPLEVPTSMTAAAMALNNFLVQQHQQQQQTQPTQLLRPQLSVVPTPSLPPNSIYQSFAPNPALAAVALAAAQQNQQTPEIHTATHHNPALQQQQQQAVLLSLLMRAQQSQQAQLAAAAATAGFLHSGSVPGTLTSLSSNPYPVNFCSQNLITNVAYINEKGNLLETLPICRDFKAGKCHRNSDCRYVHLVDENVEVTQGRVIVCRDAAKGRCTRMPCKYYHIPLFAISANRSMALNSALASATGSSSAANL